MREEGHNVTTLNLAEVIGANTPGPPVHRWVHGVCGNSREKTAFDDMNKDTEGLLRVLLKQGEITLDEKGYYQRKDFDWEENLTMMGLMKKREKNFYIPDDSLDEYTKQLENQLKEYNEIKEIFKKYYVMGNETMYDGCCKMQDEIDELKEENKELKQRLEELELQILEED